MEKREVLRHAQRLALIHRIWLLATESLIVRPGMA